VTDSDAHNWKAGSLSETVLKFSAIIEGLASPASEVGLSEADWAPLSELVATDEFQRVGIWREEMDWQDYVEFLTLFANAKGFETTVRRITETANLVFYEIEERHIRDGQVNVVNSMSVYEFNGLGEICRLDVYIQGVVDPSVPIETLTRRRS
jgi:hypothetical protein